MERAQEKPFDVEVRLIFPRTYSLEHIRIWYEFETSKLVAKFESVSYKNQNLEAG